MTTGPSPTSYPALMSAPRFTTLLASTLVSLASGTNYTFSAYAPQLGARLGLSHTRLNVIALSASVGAYASGPIWGKAVDSRGPRPLLAGGAIFLMIGYLGIWKLFNAGLLPTETTVTAFCFFALNICSFGTGAGSIAGHMSSTNATAKTFPDRARATTTGLVISALGLSAFFFSTIARMLFPGDTSSFLLLLAFGTSVPMILGLFLVRPIPLPPSECYNTAAVYENGATVEGALNTAEAPGTLFQSQSEEGRRPLLSSEESDEPNEVDQGRTLELSRSRSRHSDGFDKEFRDSQPNIYGRKLCRSTEFWLLFSMFSMLSGTGLTYINNVGAMSQALYVHSHPTYNDEDAQKWQAVQVSTLSVTNFAGRVAIGLTSDFIKTRLRWPRSYCLVLTSLSLFTSQYIATRIENVESLWIASAMVGLGYGSIFSLFSSMCIEWLGLPHFSENWGYTTTSTLLSTNLFAIVFGRNLDAHEPPARRGLPAEISERTCLEGKACYVDALSLTMSACALCVGLSVYAAWRDQKKLARLESHGRRRALES